MKSKLLPFLLLFSVTAFSQVPGYIGKRFTVGYSISPEVGLLSLKASLIHSLGLGYVVGKRQELVFNTGYSKNEEQELAGVAHTELSYSLALKLYSRRGLTAAPLGHYIKWEVIMSTNKLLYPVYDDRIYNPQTNTSATVSRSGGAISYKSLGLAYGLGRQRIFFNNLVLEYGMRFGLTFPLQGSVTNKNQHESDIYNDSGATFDPFFNIRLGLGFLAF